MKRDDAKRIASDALTELKHALEQGHSEALTRYLTTMSRFHRYSWGNCLLIAFQMPDATHVAGFRRWLELGRHVRKGESGIGILAPLAYRKREESDGDRDGDEVTLRGFKVVHVFDISQTEGDALPELGSIEGNVDDLLPRMEDLLRRSGISLVYEDLGHGTKGVSRKGEIAIACGLPPPERMAVMAHEVAHELMHTIEQREGLSKTVRETEAEAVAYVVCRAFGLDCSTRSSDYIQLYRGTEETLSESLDRIQKTAAQIIESLSQPMDQAEEGERDVA